MTNEKAKRDKGPGMAPLADPAHIGDMAKGMMRAQARIMDAVLRQSIESIDFLKTRYEKDRALYAALAQAEDSQQISAIWSEFLAGATSDYSAEAGKLSALAAVTTEEIVEGIDDEIKVATGGTPRKRKP
ncbi:hypothetical protein [Phaeovulum sp.]|uniref:hypothetical protein n=1 Tax=Phaeovulum sp. TaxID=2934796 RepID=UPI00356AEA90